MEKEDRRLAQQLSQRFGGLGYRGTVTSETTHLVCGQNKRTINTLKAMLRGCWILSRDWLLGSLEEGQWLEERDFELVSFSPAVKLLREERQTFRGVFQSDLFKGKHSKINFESPLTFLFPLRGWSGLRELQVPGGEN